MNDLPRWNRMIKHLISKKEDKPKNEGEVKKSESKYSNHVKRGRGVSE